MKNLKKKIVITGGSGRFGLQIKNFKTKHYTYFPSRKKLDILNLRKIKNYLKKIKPDILVHLAGLSRPMNIHEKNIKKSIDLNIIGTANITKASLFVVVITPKSDIERKYNTEEKIMATTAAAIELPKIIVVYRCICFT